MPELTTEIYETLNDVTLDAEEENEDDDEDAASSQAKSTLTPYGQLNCTYGCSKYFYTQLKTKAYYDSITPEQREAIKMEYYKSYDFMTGIRTAEFLGGAILLFSLFVLYKMKCRPGGSRRKSVAVNKMTAENSDTLANPVSQPEMTSSPDILISEPVIDKDSGCHNGSAHTINSSRGDSCRLEMVSLVHLARPNAGRFSCGNINGPPSLFLSESLLRPSSVRCMSLGSNFGLHQPSFHRRPVHLRTSDQSNELIDIQIIQPTPNASPRGSSRRLSEGSSYHRLSLPIPKSQSCLQTALSTGRTSRKLYVKPRRLSFSPGDCKLSSQSIELIGNRVIPNSPSTPTFGQQNCAATSSATSSTLSPIVDLMGGQSRFGQRRFSNRSVVDELVDVHRSPRCDVKRRASTECHVSWLPVASRQTIGLPLDVNCVLLENENNKISETRC